MAKIDGFFQIRKNVIYERARFNRRVQQPDELVEQFITNLYHLAEHCEYGELRNEMIRDHIVVGIWDSVLSERLQLDPELTLEKAKILVRQREAVHEQQQFLSRKPNDAETMVEAVSKSSEVSSPTDNHLEVFQAGHHNKGDNKYAHSVEGELILVKFALPKRQLATSAIKKAITAQCAILSQFQIFQKSLILSLMQ